MIAVYALIYIPIVLFVIAFIYETFLSLARLKYTRYAGSGYVDATWEVTNTLLVFGVVMLLMLFTKSIDRIASAIFVSTMAAGVLLIVRAACYMYLFYIKQNHRIGLIDWLFATVHVLTALCLVITVVRATWFIVTEHPKANVQFVPYFLPGLAFVLFITAIPLFRLYKS